mmetsp:Transcript_29023/g.71443  ORF Transcript_29023/g.71443 Transcript_29023/m.71443 type:complete len:130 (+) Transcript_29023:215-604(+)
MPAVTRAVLGAQRGEIVAFGGKPVSLPTFNDEFKKRRAGESAAAATAAAEMCAFLEPARAAQAAAELAKCPLGADACTLADAVCAHKVLTSKPFATAALSAAAELARRAASERFTLSAYFRNAVGAASS